MMSLKSSTKHYSDAPQPSGLKGPTKKNLDARAEKEVLQGKDVGTYLNQIADPNWVDPAKMRKVGGDNLDKDAFMKLMLAQIKHQDPMNPMESHDMAAQLAQFSQLEQLTNLNGTVTDMAAGQKPAAEFQALNFIGKSVNVDTSRVIRSKGDINHEIRFRLPADAKEMKIVVKDLAGKIIKTFDKTDVKQGDMKFSWVGNTDDGDIAPAGEYKFTVEAKSETGQKLHVATAFKGKVTGLNFTKEGPVLMVGDQSFKINDIQKIEDSQLKDSEQKGDNKKVAPGKAEVVKGGAEEIEKKNHLESVAMASGLKNKIAKAEEMAKGGGGDGSN